jgi:hypothetical protein
MRKCSNACHASLRQGSKLKECLEGVQDVVLL